MAGNVSQLETTTSNAEIEFKVVPRVYLEGRAIAIDLSSCEAIRKAATVKRPHMTLVFSEQGYSERDLQRAQAIVNEWMSYRHYETIEFILVPWGPRSRLVKGMLEQLGLHVRDMMGPYQNRPLHVEMHPKTSTLPFVM